MPQIHPDHQSSLAQRDTDHADPSWSARLIYGHNVLPLCHGNQIIDVELPARPSGVFSLEFVSPRPVSVQVGDKIILTGPLSWRSFQREVRGTILMPAAAMPSTLRFTLDEKPRHPSAIDDLCPSRNRARTLEAVDLRHPDTLLLRLLWRAENWPVATAIIFRPTQFVQDGLLWQHTELFAPESVTSGTAVGRSRHSPDALSTTVFMPVTRSDELPEPLREIGAPEDRPEPSIEIADFQKLELQLHSDAISIEMPVFEPRGRLFGAAPYAPNPWPEARELLAIVPQPVLPDRFAGFLRLHNEAWRMLASLRRSPARHSGLPSDFISTGSTFSGHQFVWDTAFMTMAAAYGHRAASITSSLDVLYSLQFDGGYIHRQYDVADGTPALFEPDFSPNPPLMAIAEWRAASLSGDRDRLIRVYPTLAAQHRWLAANRRLPNGAFWTTGLASGCDNTPAVGEGYPDLTAQMALDAETLAAIARKIGLGDEAVEFEEARLQYIRTLNDDLWNEQTQFYAPTLASGGHSPVKSVSGFWPMWAGAAPAERVAAMRGHLIDETTFARPHRVASLAADDVLFQPAGHYWRGAVWPPTNFAVMAGLARNGARILAREIALNHLENMAAVFEQTGSIWENYSSETQTPGKPAGRDFGWSALGPIAGLYEFIIGLEPDALNNTLTWHLNDHDGLGVHRYPLGGASISLMAKQSTINVITNEKFNLKVKNGDWCKTFELAPGTTTIDI